MVVDNVLIHSPEYYSSSSNGHDDVFWLWNPQDCQKTES
jgi:hypothetical protein